MASSSNRDAHSNCIFGVVRHTERADAPFIVDHHRQSWGMSSDSQNWPFDPPLSEDGLQAAVSLGSQIRAFTEQCHTEISVVVTSPYLRCMQTTQEICRQMKPGIRVLVDDSLGEIYGPNIMGPTEPSRVVRSVAGRNAKKKHLGKWPTWPEDPRSGRIRFASRFLTYLQRSRVTERNFLLITHADAVGAALSMMPSHAQHVVESIDYGGMFLAQRSIQKTPPTFMGNAMLGTLLGTPSTDPEGDDAQTGNGDEMILEGDQDNHGNQDAAANLGLGWKISTYGIQTSVLEGASQKYVESRVNAMAKNSVFSPDQILRLLSPLHERPLGHSLEDGAEGTEDHSASSSTVKFGGSTNSSSVHGSSRNSFAPLVMAPVHQPCSEAPIHELSSETKEVKTSRDFVTIMRERSMAAASGAGPSPEGPRTRPPLLVGDGQGASVVQRRGLNMKLSL